MKQILLRGAAASLLVLLAASAFAQAGAGADSGVPGVLTGWHIVRPGETLIQITNKYLGTADRWRDNWRLNPAIQDPNVIQPGTRLRVILDFETAPPVARLRTVTGRVEARPVPIPWNQAQVEDLLVERDGLRTHRNSSTELQFRDGTNLVLSEESLVFVRPSQRLAAGPTKRSVEIVEGQAEVQALEAGAPRTDVEILVGTAKATATQTDDGLSQTRARKAQDGSAQVMVYEGASEVEAAGQSVAVRRGMGTAVPQDAPPSPPEELLAAPMTLEPANGSEWRYGDPWFAWEPIAGAAVHTIEICRDPRCSELVLRAVDLKSSRWRPEPLPTGELFWRVTAVSASGLDGFPSDPAPFTIRFTSRDTTPPTGQVTVTGRSVTSNGVTFWEPRARLEVTMTDDESGLDSWAVQVDRRQLAESELAGPWRTGLHTAKALGVDRIGNLGETPPVSFEVDADGPAIEIRLGGRELLTERLGERAVPKRWDRRKRNWIKTHTRPTAGRRPVWTALASGSDASPIGDGYNVNHVLTKRQRTDTRIEISGNNPGALLFLAGKLRIGPRTVTVRHGLDVTLFEPDPRGGPGTEKNAVLWVGANDERSGQVASLTIDTETRPGSDPEEPSETYLVIDAEDVFGNRRHVEVRIRPLEG